jgi:hypothetical protein
VRLYLRKPGLRRVRLQAADGSKQLEFEVERLLAALGGEKPKPQTLEAATRQYETRTPEFKNLAESTKYEHRLILSEFVDHLSAAPVASFKPIHVQKLRDQWAGRGHRAANVRLQVLKNVRGTKV